MRNVQIIFPLLFPPPLSLWSSAKAFVGLFPNKKKKKSNFSNSCFKLWRSCHGPFFLFLIFCRHSQTLCLHSLDDNRSGILTPVSREQSHLTCTPCCSCQPPDAWADPHTCKGSNHSQAPGPHHGIWSSPKFHPWELLDSPHSGVWRD